jgi:hypothetical protein
MYRSNDVVQFNRKGFFIRPFVKVGEKAKSVKVFQYFIEDTNTYEADITIQQLQRLGLPARECNCRSEAKNAYNPEEDLVMRKRSIYSKAIECRCQASTFTRGG